MEMPNLQTERVAFIGDLAGTERIYRHLVITYGGSTTNRIDERTTLVVKGFIDSELEPMHVKLNVAKRNKIRVITEKDFMSLLNPIIEGVTNGQ